MDLKEELLAKALQCRAQAYAPYSKYQVGAAIYSENEHIYGGCNVENVSYPCGTCAEAGAISAMISAGDKKIKSILVVSGGKTLVYPCGACLQRIMEFGDKNTKVYLANPEGIEKEYNLSELLPHNFNATELKK